MIRKRTRRRKSKYSTEPLRGVQRLEPRFMLAAEVMQESPWTNPVERLDANGDGEITARDALVVINQLAANDGQTSGEPSILPPLLDGESMHFDANGDRQISAIDALWIINGLGSRAETESADQIDIESESPVSESRGNVVDLAFEHDFARVRGVLSTSEVEWSYRFEAERDNIALDLSSTLNESLARIQVFDELGIEVVSNESSEGRSRFEGIKFPTIAGRSYTIVTSLRTEHASTFPFTLDVMQFDVGDWPGVIVSRDPGLAWANSFGPDSALGSDIHSDEADSATPLRPFEREIRFRSNIDEPGDVDWFRVSNVSNAISISLNGNAGNEVRLDVFDTELNAIEPITSVIQNGLISIGTYQIPPQDGALIRLQGVATSIGQYNFTLRDTGFTPVEEANTEPLGVTDRIGDRIETAADLGIHSGHILLDERLETGEDVDFFRIPNALPGTVIVSGIPGISADLFDQDGNLIERGDPLFNLQGRVDVARYDDFDQGSQSVASDYVFLRVSSSLGGVGRYNITFSFQGDPPENLIDFNPIDTLASATLPDSEFGDDQHGATPEDSTRYPNGDPAILVSHLDFADDVDVFSMPGYNGVRDVSISVHTQDATGIQLIATDAEGNVFEPDRVFRDEHTFGFEFRQLDLTQHLQGPVPIRPSIYISVSSDRQGTGRYTLVSGVSGTDSIAGIDAHGPSLSTATDLGELVFSERVYSSLEGPTDQDAFRFTAESSRMTVKMRRLSDQLALRGQGVFHVYDAEGNRIEPTREEETGIVGLTLDYLDKDYDLTVGQEYILVVSNEQEEAFGRYNMLIRPLGITLDDLGYQVEETIELDDARIVNHSLSGRLDFPGQVKYFRFVSDHDFVSVRSVNPENDSRFADNVNVAFFRESDGVQLGTEGGSTQIFSGLVDATAEQQGEYILAVRLSQHAQDGEAFLIRNGFRRATSLGPDEVGDSIEEATPLDLSAIDESGLPVTLGLPSPSRLTSLRVLMNSADDVDVYSLTAIESTVTVTILPLLFPATLVSQDELTAHELLVVELVDQDGNTIESRESVEQVGAIELHHIEFDTIPNESYYLRLSQTTLRQALMQLVIR